MTAVCLHICTCTVKDGRHKSSFVAASGGAVKPLWRRAVYFVSGRYAEETRRLARMPVPSHWQSVTPSYISVCRIMSACVSRYFCVLILSERLPFFHGNRKAGGACGGVWDGWGYWVRSGTPVGLSVRPCKPVWMSLNSQAPHEDARLIKLTVRSPLTSHRD